MQKREKVFLQLYSEKAYQAGTKAARDTEVVLASLGYRQVSIYSHFQHKNLDRMYRIAQLVKVVGIKKNSIILMQHPGMAKALFVFYPFLKVIKKMKKFKIIFFIHDLESIRGLNGRNKRLALLDENRMIRLADVALAHNDRMKQTLVNTGNIEADRVIPLYIFDYMMKESYEMKKSESQSIVYAGNLMYEKSAFAYSLKEIADVPFSLYGINYRGYSDNRICYCGSFDPDVLPEKLEGKYGLVWDGDSLESCIGDTGKYLRYNTSHKISLYLVAGLPVVIWKKAVMAKTIEKYNLGFTIDSLYELKKKLELVSEESYSQMRENAIKYAEKIKRGDVLREAVENAEKIIERN